LIANRQVALAGFAEEFPDGAAESGAPPHPDGHQIISFCKLKISGQWSVVSGWWSAVIE
jgi:hypothetical protein